MAQRFEVSMKNSATPLSERRRRCPSPNGALAGLARLSLVTALASMLSGCLVDDPPPYPEPKQTPPRLDYTTATPSLNQIIRAKKGDTLDFRIFSSSEDAGDGLKAYLYLDFNGDTSQFPVRDDDMPPSTLDDTSRFFTISWPISQTEPAGCHRLTLRVSHAKNVPILSNPPLDPSDVAEAYWWMQLDAGPNDSNDLLNCPSATSGAP
jgi:hypothetical protein